MAQVEQSANVIVFHYKGEGYLPSTFRDIRLKNQVYSLYSNSFDFYMKSDKEELKMYYGMIFYNLIKRYESYFKEMDNLKENQPPETVPEIAEDIWRFLDKLEQLGILKGINVEKEGEKIVLRAKEVSKLDKDARKLLSQKKMKCSVHYIINQAIQNEFSQSCDSGTCRYNNEKDEFVSTYKINPKKEIQKQRIKKRDLFPNNDMDFYEEEFKSNLAKWLKNANFKPRFCENFYESQIIICKQLKQRKCPLFVLINHKEGKIHRATQCEGNFALIDIL
ncbi:MAG: hypothetical protein ACFFCS_13200 [Candidatus Hodarchaeota archaeon]